ncbi:MAG: hypothetical protein AAF808_12750, partial [Cyanobacteria bacterium P01_D01_bin.2]
QLLQHFEQQKLKVIIPTQATSEYQKQMFQTKLLQLWFNTLGIWPDDWQLSPADAQALADYFYICELMVRCKQLAVRVSPQVWAGIESRMVTVPAQHSLLVEPGLMSPLHSPLLQQA